MVPRVDVIVLGFHAVDEAFNGVAVVVDEEDDWLEAMTNHGAHFLGRQLERAIANKENGSSLVVHVAGSGSSTLRGTDRPANATPQDLAESCDASREPGIPDTKVGCASLCNDNVVLDEEFTHTWPEPRLVNGLAAVLRNLILDQGAARDRQLGHVKFLGNLAENTPHANARICGVPDDAVVAVKVNGVELRSAIREAGGIEVALEATNGEDEIRRLDSILGTGRVGTSTCIYATKVVVLFVDGALAHGRDKDGQFALFDELVHFIENVVSNGAGVNENDGLLRGVKIAHNDVDDVVFPLGLILGLREVDGRVEASTLNLSLGHVGGHHDVDGLGANEALAQAVVNLYSNVGRVVELGDVAGNVGAHVGKDVEVAIAEGVMQKHAIALRDGGRAADNVDDGDVFGIGTGDAIDGRELTDAKGGDEGTDAVDSSVAVSSVSYNDES